MATIDDSITGDENVKALRSAELTIKANPREASVESHELKVEAFLRRVLPVVSDNATNPVQALVPWVCDVLQSKQSLEVTHITILSDSIDDGWITACRGVMIGDLQ